MMRRQCECCARVPLFVDGIHAADVDQSGPEPILVVSTAWSRRGWPPGGVCSGERIEVGRPVNLGITAAQARAAGDGAMGVEEFYAWAEARLLAIPVHEWPVGVSSIRRMK